MSYLRSKEPKREKAETKKRDELLTAFRQLTLTRMLLFTQNNPCGKIIREGLIWVPMHQINPCVLDVHTQIDVEAMPKTNNLSIKSYGCSWRTGLM